MQAGGAASFARPAALFCVLVAGCLLICAAVSNGQEKAEDEGPRIRKIGPHLYRIGTVVLDAAQKTVRCSGRVNMSEGGPIELLACLPRGKTHETVFTLELRPIDLQTALILLGLREGRNPAVKYYEDEPEREQAPGDKVWIFVEWQPKDAEEDAPKRRARGEEFLFDDEAEEPVKQAEWVFLGSQFSEYGFGADMDGSLITTFHDPLAILELVLPKVNDDVYYFVNEGLCPPVGTPVELVIQVPPKKDAEQEEEDSDEDGPES